MKLKIYLKRAPKTKDPKTGKSKIVNVLSLPVPDVSPKKQKEFIKRELGYLKPNVKSYQIVH